MSPVLTWGLRYAACVAVGLVLPALPPPVRPLVVMFVIFAAWALAADDAKKAGLVEPAAARSRYRPR